MRANAPTAADAALVRRTSTRLAVQAAVLVALAVLVLTALAGLVELRQQRSTTESLLRQAIERADDVSDPPSGTWLVLRTPSGREQVTPGIPNGFPEQRDLATVASTGITLQRDVTVHDHGYRVRTERRATHTIQAILDLRGEQREESHLITALLVVGAGGLALAGVVGAVLARRAVRPLVDALALQREFVADASHELRTPLTLLSTRVQLLRRALVSHAADRELLSDADGVVRDTSRLVAVVDDLLLSADPRAYDAYAECDLGVLCAEVVESARGYASDRGVHIESVVSDGDEVRAEVNAVAVRRAVTALVDNAITHTPDGGHVVVTTHQDGRDRIVEVRDTGHGLAPGAESRIFDRFHSGSHRAGRRGYGLGLSLAQGVAVRHGGSLSVASSGPEGTTFALRLPARRAAARDERQPRLWRRRSPVSSR